MFNAMRPYATSTVATCFFYFAKFSHRGKHRVNFNNVSCIGNKSYCRVSHTITNTINEFLGTAGSLQASDKRRKTNRAICKHPRITLKLIAENNSYSPLSRCKKSVNNLSFEADIKLDTNSFITKIVKILD